MDFCFSNSKKKNTVILMLYCNHEPKLNLNKELYDKNSEQKFARKTLTSCKPV